MHSAHPYLLLCPLLLPPLPLPLQKIHPKAKCGRNFYTAMPCQCFLLTHIYVVPAAAAAAGNPSEGEMRPQLLDRFGMSVSVSTIEDTELRTQMVLDRMAYEEDPDALYASGAAEQDALRQKLEEARQRLPSVRCSEQMQIAISDVCSRLEVDGLRGDLVINRAAKALVAFEGEHQQAGAGILQSHRIRLL